MIAWPEPIEPISTPAITGISCRPDSVGVAPRTTCWNSGRYVSAPNSAKPITKPIALVTAKTRLRNRCSGRIGSAARDSCQMKAPMPATATTPSATISAEPQA